MKHVCFIFVWYNAVTETIKWNTCCIIGVGFQRHWSSACFWISIQQSSGCICSTRLKLYLIDTNVIVHAWHAVKLTRQVFKINQTLYCYGNCWFVSWNTCLQHVTEIRSCYRNMWNTCCITRTLHQHHSNTCFWAQNSSITTRHCSFNVN